MAKPHLLVRTTLVALALAGCCTTAGAAGEGAQIEHYAATAAVAVQGRETLQRLRVPLAALQSSRSPGLADLRVFDGDGKPLAQAWAGAPAAEAPAPERVGLPHFAWPTATAVAAAAPLRIEWRSDGSVLRIHRGDGQATPAPERTTAWLVDLKPLDDRPAAALQLEWAPQAAEGLVRRVRAESSSDAQAWSQAGQAVLVELASAAGGARRVVQQRLALQPLPARTRYLRLTADGPWPLAGVQAELSGGRAQPPQESLDTLRMALREGEFDLGAPLALRRLQVVLPAGHAVVPLVLERRSGENWVPVASHTAYRLEQGGAAIESPPLELPGVAARHWRLRTETARPPAEVIVHWQAPQLAFVASGREPYRLAVGLAGAEAKALPMATLLPGYKTGDEHRLPLATLGPLQARPPGNFWQEGTPQERRRWVLWAVLCLAVAGLGGLAWRLAREMRSPGRDP